MGWTATVRFPAAAKHFSLLRSVQTDCGAHQPPAQLVPRALSLGVKRPGRETDHSPPSSADVKNDGAIPPLPIRLHGVVLN
jgi:hypothetical protein